MKRRLAIRVLVGSLATVFVSLVASAQVLPTPTSGPTLNTTPTGTPKLMIGTVNILGTVSGGNRCVAGGPPCVLIGQFGEKDD